MDVLELYSKPIKEKFSPEEIAFLKTKFKKSDYQIRYCFYNKKSSKNRYVVFVIDSMPYATRRSAVENNWEVFCTRGLSNIEYQEQIQNFGSNHRRFKVWNYQNVEQLIADDAKYNIATPREFVEECKKRGYTGTVQLQFNLESTV